MTNITQYPILNAFKTTLNLAYAGGTGTISLTDAPWFTFPSGKIVLLGINMGKANEQVVRLDDWDNVVSISVKKNANGDLYTAQSHLKGDECVITDFFEDWDNIATAIASKANIASPVFTWFIALPSYADATARDEVITSPQNWMLVYNEGTSLNEQYIWGAWVSVWDTGTPNASETVAGKVEIATQTQYDDWTDIGETGAKLVAKPSQIKASIDGLPNSITKLTSSFTAGENIGVDINSVNFLYQWSDWKVYKTKANDLNKVPTDKIIHFKGVCFANDTIYCWISWIATWLSWLITGSPVYITDTLWWYSYLQWTNKVEVWVALSTTSALLHNEPIINNYNWERGFIVSLSTYLTYFVSWYNLANSVNININSWNWIYNDKWKFSLLVLSNWTLQKVTNAWVTTTLNTWVGYWLIKWSEDKNYVYTTISTKKINVNTMLVEQTIWWTMANVSPSWNLVTVITNNQINVANIWSITFTTYNTTTLAVVWTYTWASTTYVQNNNYNWVAIISDTEMIVYMWVWQNWSRVLRLYRVEIATWTVLWTFDTTSWSNAQNWEIIYHKLTNQIYYSYYNNSFYLVRMSPTFTWYTGIISNVYYVWYIKQLSCWSISVSYEQSYSNNKTIILIYNNTNQNWTILQTWLSTTYWYCEYIY